MKKQATIIEIILRAAKGLAGTAAPDVGTAAMGALVGLEDPSGRGHLRTRLKTREIGRQMDVGGFFGPSMSTASGQGPAYDWMNRELHIPPGSQEATIAHEVGHKKLHDFLGKAFGYASGVSRLGSKLAPAMGGWAGGSKEPTLVPGYIQAALAAPMMLDEAAATALAIHNQIKHRGLKGLMEAWPLLPALGTYASQALAPLAVGKLRKTLEASPEAAKVAAELHCIERLPGSLSQRRGITEADVVKIAGEEMAHFHPHPTDLPPEALARIRKKQIAPGAWLQVISFDSVPLEATKQADDKVIRLPGSLSRREGVNVGDVDKKQLEMGVKVEREHVAEKPLARGISLDHLAEIPDYYTRLKKMEAEAKKGA